MAVINSIVNGRSRTSPRESELIVLVSLGHTAQALVENVLELTFLGGLITIPIDGSIGHIPVGVIAGHQVCDYILLVLLILTFSLPLLGLMEARHGAAHMSVLLHRH